MSFLHISDSVYQRKTLRYLRACINTLGLKEYFTHPRQILHNLGGANASITSEVVIPSAGLGQLVGNYRRTDTRGR